MIRDWDGTTLAALAAFLGRHGLADGPPEPRRIGEGHSNLTYLIRGGNAVLRRLPPPPLPKGANDVLREARVLKASAGNVAAMVDATDIGAAISALGTPTVAAVNGLTVTGGFEIALACDMIVAAESAWFQDGHAKIGLMPGWELSQRLQRTIGRRVPRRLP
jgi:hypothetical protein